MQRTGELVPFQVVQDSQQLHVSTTSYLAVVVHLVSRCSRRRTFPKFEAQESMNWKALRYCTVSLLHTSDQYTLQVGVRFLGYRFQTTRLWNANPHQQAFSCCMTEHVQYIHYCAVTLFRRFAHKRVFLLVSSRAQAVGSAIITTRACS